MKSVEIKPNLSPLIRGYENYRNRILKENFGAENSEELVKKVLDGDVSMGKVLDTKADFISKKYFETAYYFTPVEILSLIKIKESYEYCDCLLTSKYKDISALGVFADGRVIIGRNNGSILLLGNVDGGVSSTLIGGQGGKIDVLTLMPDGDIFSASRQKEIMQWKFNPDGSCRKKSLGVFDKDEGIDQINDVVVSQNGSILVEAITGRYARSRFFKLLEEKGVYRMVEFKRGEDLTNFAYSQKSVVDGFKCDGPKILLMKDGESVKLIWQANSDVQGVKLLADGRIVYATKSEVRMLK